MNHPPPPSDLLRTHTRETPMDDEQINALTAALRAIAHGTTDGPTGLELVAMALAERSEPSVAEALGRCADSLGAIAGAIEELTVAVEART